MPRKKKFNVKTSKSNENISDILKEFKNDEEIIKQNIKKNIQKIKNQKKQSNQSELSNLSNESNESKISNDVKIDHAKIEEKNKIKLAQLAVIDKLCNDYSNLKNDKKKIIKNIVMEEKKQNDKKNYNDVYTLDKIILDDEIYYKDNCNNILDVNAKLVGFCKELEKQYEIILFP